MKATGSREGSGAVRVVKGAIRDFGHIPLRGRWLRWFAPRTMRQAEMGSRPLSIAIVNLIPFLGDTILYLPLVDALRARHPDARIAFVCAASASGILRSYPGLDEVIACTMSESSFLSRVPLARDYERLITTGRMARSAGKKNSFDVALIPRGGADPFFSAHAAWLMNIPRIYGYSSVLEPERLFMQYGSEALMTDAVKQKRHLHESMRALEVAELAGLLPPHCWSEQQTIQGLKALAEAQDTAAIADLAGIEERQPYAVISPGAGALRRQWPAERFREIALRLSRDSGLTVLVAGTRAEQDLAESLSQADPRIKNLAGKLSLLQLIGLLNRATLFVGNDSGPGHIAGALGVPTISLNAYAASAPLDHHQSPARNRPVGPGVVVLRPESFLSPCTDECLASEPHCLNQIQTEEVWQASVKILQSVG